MESVKYVQQNQNWIEAAREAWEARNMRLLYEKAEARAFAKLKELSNNSPSIAGDYIFDFSERKGTIDYNAIPELQSVNLETYRKDSVVIWKIEKIITITKEDN